jgi:serine/threonine-protein kinase
MANAGPRFQPGDRLLDVYVVERTLGEGGFNEVVLARHQVLARKYAIKVLRQTAADSPADLERLKSRVEREAIVLSRFDHPNLPTLHDMRIQDGVPILVLEYLEGKDLLRVLDLVPRLTVQDALYVGIEVAKPLVIAHQREIVHRDLKPENIFCMTEPPPEGKAVVRLLDFGASRLMGEAKRITEDLTVIGSMYYIAPETLMTSSTPDQRVDVYALGLVLWESLAGHHPFDPEGKGVAPTRMGLMHMTEPVRYIRDLRPDVPARFADLVRAMVDKSPGERPTMQVVYDELWAVLSTMQHAADRVGQKLPTIFTRQGTRLPDERLPSGGVVSSRRATRRSVELAGSRRDPGRPLPSSAIPSSAIPSSAIPSTVVPSTVPHVPSAAATDREPIPRGAQPTFEGAPPSHAPSSAMSSTQSSIQPVRSDAPVKPTLVANPGDNPFATPQPQPDPRSSTPSHGAPRVNARPGLLPGGGALQQGPSSNGRGARGTEVLPQHGARGSNGSSAGTANDLLVERMLSLGQLAGSAEARAALEAGLSHAELEVRRAAAQSLSRVGDARSVVPLAQACIAEKDPEVRRTMELAIDLLGGDVAALVGPSSAHAGMTGTVKLEDGPSGHSSPRSRGASGRSFSPAPGFQQVAPQAAHPFSISQPVPHSLSAPPAITVAEPDEQTTLLQRLATSALTAPRVEERQRSLVALERESPVHAERVRLAKRVIEPAEGAIADDATRVSQLVQLRAGGADQLLIQTLMRGILRPPSERLQRECLHVLSGEGDQRHAAFLEQFKKDHVLPPAVLSLVDQAIRDLASRGPRRLPPLLPTQLSNPPPGIAAASAGRRGLRKQDVLALVAALVVVVLILGAFVFVGLR